MKLTKKLKKCLPAVWRYQADLKECRLLEAKIEKSRPPNSNEAHESGAFGAYFAEYTDAYQWRRSLITNEYRRRLERLSVPMPDYCDEKFWELLISGITGEEIRCLTTAGELAARSVIREEQKHRREVWAFWFSWLTGLGGIAIGLVSVWPK